jgi:ubiquinol-cytochrome c reductase cytochrome c subunit
VRDVPPPLAPDGQLPVERGRTLYLRGCAGCHGQQGQGSQNGPSLVGVGAASAHFQLSTGRMPLAEVVDQPPRARPAYSSTDLDALVEYVASLGPGQPIPHLPEGDLQAGRKLYIANCASCHSSSGVGAALPDGHYAPNVLGDSSQQVAEAVRVGPGLMPRFSSDVLTDEQLASIVTYVRQIPEHDARGGWPLGGLGPLTEGAAGWAFGLGLLLVVIRLLGQRAEPPHADEEAP